MQTLFELVSEEFQIILSTVFMVHKSSLPNIVNSKIINLFAHILKFLYIDVHKEQLYICIKEIIYYTLINCLILGVAVNFVGFNINELKLVRSIFNLDRYPDCHIQKWLATTHSNNFIYYFKVTIYFNNLRSIFHLIAFVQKYFNIYSTKSFKLRFLVRKYSTVYFALLRLDLFIYNKCHYVCVCIILRLRLLRITCAILKLRTCNLNKLFN